MGATFSKLWHCASRATQLAILPLWFGACLIAAIAIPLFICTAGSPVAVLYCFVKWLLTRTQDEARIYSRYEYGPSESRLLELPPETRGEIWQHLLWDHDTVYVELKDELLTMTLCEKISVIGAPRGFLGPLPDFKFQRTSRQVYAEVDHMFYTTRTFCFTDQPTFTAFVEGLNIVQKRNVKNVYICVNSIFFKPNSQSSLTSATVTMMQSIRDLPDLQILELWIDAPKGAGEKYLAQGVYQILKNVQVSQSIIVKLFGPSFLGFRGIRWRSVEWSLDSQKQFANTVWSELRHPGSLKHEDVRVENGDRPQCVLSFQGPH